MVIRASEPHGSGDNLDKGVPERLADSDAWQICAA
jgi:hypothetical protein